jgi:4'-phosphopantetheinyl transferase
MTEMRRATWLPSPPNARPSRDEVHVWRASLDRDDSEVERLWAALTPDERERAQRFRFDRDRRRFVVARGVLREILGRCLGLGPALIRFSYNEYGKPSLREDAGGLRFNVSHSAGAALYACTLGREVGIDIELLRDEFASFEIAERYFSQAEVRSLGSLPAHMRTQGFFNCWTRKEAYIKALGEGLSHPLDCFSVSLAPGEPARLISTDKDRLEAARWSIVDLKPFQGYAAALAIWASDPEIQCWDWQ